MSSILGSFQSCAGGNQSTTLTCTGTFCAALQNIPGLTCTTESGSTTCTNGHNCAAPANLTSSFALQGNGLNISQTHNVTINGQMYHVVGSGANFTNSTKAGTAHSSANRPFVPGLTSLLICFLLLSAQAFAATPDVTEFTAVEDQYDSVLGSLLEPLNVGMCQLATSTHPTTLLDEAFVELDVLMVCFADLMVTLLGLSGSLIDIDDGVANGTSIAWNTSLPINDPETLFMAAIGDSILCLEVAAAILNDPSGNTATEICAPFLSAAPATPTSNPLSPTGITPTGAVVPNTALPSSWPSANDWTGYGQCRACQFGYQYLERITDITYGPATCNNDNPPISAMDIASWVCADSDSSGGTPFGPLCSYLCSNQCETWSLETIIAGMGSAYINSTLDTQCIAHCGGQDPPPLFGGYICPGSLNWEISPNDNNIPTCQCGTGVKTCFPVPVVVDGQAGCSP